VAETKAKYRKKNVQLLDLSLEKHQDASSLNVVSNLLCHTFEFAAIIGLEFLFSKHLIQTFLALGTECLEFCTATDNPIFCVMFLYSMHNNCMLINFC
jgi:hypothetical protein